MNETIYIRYEFHDKIDTTMPKGWKFEEKLMAKKGEKQIIFVEHVVTRDNMYDTYERSYGRQAPSEENLNEFYNILGPELVNE